MQLELFPDVPVSGLTCSFGTPWEDHFRIGIGTGKGCEACRQYRGTETKKAK